MSFLSGITNIFTGGGMGGTILRTVALGYVLNKVSSSATKQNDIGTISSVQNAPGIDNGVRLQVAPGANQKIPVLYGSAYFGGIITEAKMSNSNQRMTYVLTLAEKTGNLYSTSTATSYSFNTLRWNDQEVYFKADGVTIDYTIDRQGNKDESLNNLVKVYFYAGNSSSSSQIFPDGYSGTAVNAYDQVPTWNSAYAMNDLVFAVVEVNYSAERNIKGIGDLKFQVTSSMNKPGDVIYDYLTDNIYGANIAVSEIDTTSLTSLNTYSTSSVDYTDEIGTQTLTNRYQINGLVNTDRAVMQNVEDITNTAGSWLSYSVLTGKWGVIINREGTSVASFDDSNILGSISLGGTGLQDLYNSVKVEFPNRDIKDGRDYTTIAIPNSDRNANEQDNTLNLTYNLTNEPVQAQMLGFIELKQSRIDLVVTFSTDYSTINLNAGDIIDITNSKLGFTNKLFRIITISEQQGDDGLRSEITALEYDDTVYDEDFTRFTRTFNNELITVGNISVPGTPTITTYESDARPRIEVSTTAPSSGIIEGMEYWLSNDTGLGEAQRSYRLIATRVAPNGNAQVRGTFANDETVTLEYDTIGTSNFVVKTRAYNSTTVGPFSANSAITSFTSTQITNAINPDTQIQDELGGLATIYGIVTLLNNLDDLIDIFNGEKSIFDTVKDILFPDNAGQDNAYDILGNSSTFSNTVQSQIDTSINSLATDPDFIANVGSATVDVGNYSINALLDVDTGNINPIVNDVLAWDGSNWRPAQTCCPSLTYRDPAPGDPGYEPPPAVQAYLTRSLTLPNDITNTFGQEVTSPDVDDPAYVPSDEYDGELAPQTGSYYVYFTYPSVGAVYGNTGIYSELIIGSGDAKLYTSDGTLVETVSAGSMSVDGRRLEIPFSDRDPGTNYYILMDEGIVEYCEAISPAITLPTPWNFNTPYYTVDAYTPPYGNISVPTPPGLPEYGNLTITSISYPTANACPNSNLVIGFSESVTPGSGVISIYENNISGNLVVNIAASSGTVISNTSIDYGTVSQLEYDQTYYIAVSDGVADTIRANTSVFVCGVYANVTPTQTSSLSSDKTFTTWPALELESYSLVNLDSTGNIIVDPTYQSVSIESTLTLEFNRTISLADSDPLNISIYEAGGTLHQTFDLTTTFADDYTSELITRNSANIILNPTRDFKVGTEYYCLIDANILLDSCSTNYSGISSTSEITWKTIDFAPTVSSTGSLDGPVNDNTIQMSFGTDITPGNGNLVIYNSSNVAVANITSTNANVVYS